MIANTEFLKALPVAIYVTDAAGRITFYNETAAKFWGVEPELGSAKWCGSWKLYTRDGEPLPHDRCPMAFTLKTGKPVRGEAIAERPDGTRVHFSAFPSPIHDEAGNLVGAINLLMDITDRTQNEAALSRIAAIVSSSDDAILTKTLTGRITSWNRSAARIFGYSEREMIGESVLCIVPPELHDEEKAILSRLAQGEHIHHYETERIAKDGHRIAISLTISPLNDKSGKVIGASTIARDITEQKRAEEMQRLLLGELNHRVKNTLAIIQSIAAQTLRRTPSPEEFVSSFTGRIQALARAHTLFTRDSWQGTDVTDLIRDQLLLNDEEDGRISCSGPRLSLDPQSALSLSMILHELGTNARKYGALSAAKGRLSVGWRLDGDVMELHWTERGGPIVFAPLRHGFGTTLIEKGLKAHGGDAHINYDPEGLACEIRLPLSKPGLAELPQKAAARPVPPARPANLRGKRILVIEDEPLVLMDLENTVAEWGSFVVGPASSVERARRLIETEKFDAALVDANLGGSPVDDLAAALARKGIPFLFLTGYGRDSLPKAFSNTGMIGKPYTREQLAAAAARMLAQKQEGALQA